MDIGALDSFLNDQEQNALAFYSVFSGKPTVLTTNQINALPAAPVTPFRGVSSSDGSVLFGIDSSTLLLIGGVALVAWLVLK